MKLKASKIKERKEKSERMVYRQSGRETRGKEALEIKTIAGERVAAATAFFLFLSRILLSFCSCPERPSTGAN